MTVTHAPQCSWHCDQYPHECDCGAIQPATRSWAEREFMAAEDNFKRAKKRLAYAKSLRKKIK